MCLLHISASTTLHVGLPSYLSPLFRICVRDCESGGSLDVKADCAGVVEDFGVRMYDTVRECCEEEMGWQDPDLCASLSDPSSNGSNKFYAVQQDKKCAQDCPSTGGIPCAGPPEYVSTRLFNTATECCEEKLPWLTLDQCLAATNGSTGSTAGSGDYYVKWKLNKCVRDCAIGAGVDCGGLMDVWDIPHANVGDCCDSIWWVPRDECT